MVCPFGPALKILDASGDCRGVFASRDAARSAVFFLVAEGEAGVDLSAA